MVYCHCVQSLPAHGPTHLKQLFHVSETKYIFYNLHVFMTQLVCILMNMQFFSSHHPQQTLVPFYASMHKCYRLL